MWWIVLIRLVVCWIGRYSWLDLFLVYWIVFVYVLVIGLLLLCVWYSLCVDWLGCSLCSLVLYWWYCCVVVG